MASIRLQLMRSASAMFDILDAYAAERAIVGTRPRTQGTVTLYLVGKIVNGIRSEITPAWELITVRNPSGFDIFFDRVRLNNGVVYQLDFDGGIYVLRIESEFYQVIELDNIQLPNSTKPFQISLAPGFNYPFPSATLPNGGSSTLLRGTIFATDGSGIDGARIQADGSSFTYTTDETGQWVLVFPDEYTESQVTVLINMPDGSVVEVPSVPIISGQQSTLKQAGLRGNVVNSAGIGIPKAKISVTGHVGEVISAHDGSWFYYFRLNQDAQLVSVNAVSPTGSVLVHDNIQVQPQEMVHVPDFQFQ